MELNQKMKVKQLLEIIFLYPDAFARALQPDDYSKKISLYGKTIHVTCNPSHIEHIYTLNADNYSRFSPAFRSLRYFMGDGLITTGNFAIWKKERGILSELFLRENMKQYFSCMLKNVEEKLKDWDIYAKNHQPVPIDPIFTTMALSNLMCSIFQGVTISYSSSRSMLGNGTTILT